jgi:hypothetical protein
MLRIAYTFVTRSKTAADVLGHDTRRWSCEEGSDGRADLDEVDGMSREVVGRVIQKIDVCGGD